MRKFRPSTIKSQPKISVCKPEVSLISHAYNKYPDKLFLNLLTPKSDQHLISPYNITLEFHIEVMRIKEIITS